MTETSLPPPRLTADQAAIVSASHVGVRNAGYVCCLLGVVAMVAGRYMAGTPAWLASLGLGIVVFGWGLLGYAVIRRVALARSLASRRGG